MTSETPETPGTDQNQSSPPHATTEHLINPDNIEERAKVLSKRAHRHRYHAAIILGLILLVLLTLVLVFVEASLKASAEIKKQEVLLQKVKRFDLRNRIKTIQDNSEKEISSFKRKILTAETYARDRIASLRSRIRKFERMKGDRADEIESLQSEINIVSNQTQDKTNALESRIQAVNKNSADEIESLKRQVKALEDSIDTYSKSGETNIGDMSSIFQDYTPRIGVSLVGIFAVAFLTGLYRNNIRLAVFYDARADGLRLLRDGIPADFQSLSVLMTPHVDFGKMPSTPIEHFTEMAKKIGNPLKK